MALCQSQEILQNVLPLIFFNVRTIFISSNTNKMRTNHDIVRELAERKLVETIIEKVTKKPVNLNNSNLEDLTEDVYLSLLQDRKLPIADQNNQVNFYIARIIMNNIASKTSPFYRIYLKYQNLSEPLSINLQSNINADSDIWGWILYNIYII